MTKEKTMKQTNNIEDNIDNIIDAYHNGAVRFVIDQINASQSINQLFKDGLPQVKQPACLQCHKTFVPEEKHQGLIPLWGYEFCCYECYWNWTRCHD